MKHVQDEHEVVPDWEPEREQRRKQRARPVSSQPTTASASSPEPEVRSTLHVTNGPTTHKPEGILNHSTSVSEQSDDHFTPIHAFRACPSPPPIATIESLRSSDSDQEDQVNLMQISRFAYQPPSKHVPKPRAKRQNDAVRDLGPSGVASTGGQKKDDSKTYPDHLTDTQLVRLLKCIGCGLQWTSRKTAKQKRVHIEQCAKKNALTKETIKILIEKEVNSLTQNQTPSSSGNDENATSTLMDSVVPAEPTKKTKRQQVLPTVRSLPETRETILNRARDLLGSSFRAKAGAIGDSPHTERVEIQLTQPFGKSLIARRNSENRPSLLEANRVMEQPTGTQPLATSSLGGAMKARRMVDGFDACPLPPTQQFGASKLAQGFRLENGGFSSLKRPVSPPFVLENNDRAVRQRLLH